MGGGRPASYLARAAHGATRGGGRVRIALVAPLEECVEAVQRIGQLARSL
jgi:N-succinyldiaminopimelate aminotransferase